MSIANPQQQQFIGRTARIPVHVADHVPPGTAYFMPAGMQRQLNQSSSVLRREFNRQLLGTIKNVYVGPTRQQNQRAKAARRRLEGKPSYRERQRRGRARRRVHSTAPRRLTAPL